MSTKTILKLLTILMVVTSVFTFISCSKSEDDIPTSYTLKWNFDTYGVKVTLFEYSDNGDKVANNTIDNLENNGTYTFNANERAVKVKVYIKMYSSSRWVQQVYYLESGRNIDIIITGETTIGTKEP